MRWINCFFSARPSVFLHLQASACLFMCLDLQQWPRQKRTNRSNKEDPALLFYQISSLMHHKNLNKICICSFLVISIILLYYYFAHIFTRSCSIINFYYFWNIALKNQRNISNCVPFLFFSHKNKSCKHIFCFVLQMMSMEGSTLQYILPLLFMLCLHHFCQLKSLYYHK